MQIPLNLTVKQEQSPLAVEPSPPLSPVMAQYAALKIEYPDSLLFFRLGDFYELFFDDAVTAARELDIVLTKRGRTEGQAIPMCGVPAHAYESYLAKLITKGFKVAICEQVETPEDAKKRGAKGPLKRDVVRVVTPGTLTEDSLLESRQNNFLLAVSPVTNSQIGVAYIDLSTGLFVVETTDLKNLPATLSRLQPVEIVIPDLLIQEPSLYEQLNLWKRKLSPLPQARFNLENGRRRLEDAYGVKTLDAFGNFAAAELRAAGTLIDYVLVTQKTALKFLSRPKQLSQQAMMLIDPATRRSLEIHQTLSGQKQGSLLATIDHTITAAGGRLLSYYLATPLTSLAAIQQRQDSVTFFVTNQPAGTQLRQELQQTPDMQRALSRIQFGRGAPRDLAALRDGLKQASQIQAYLSTLTLPSYLAKQQQNLGIHTLLIDKLQRALSDTLPLHARDGDFIAQGYLEELDTYRYLRDNSKHHLQALQDQYSAETTISTLKIKHNNILGYHIDIGPSHTAKILPTFIHRQSLASSVRYTTPELIELEKKIAAAAEQALDIELRLFQELVHDVQQLSDSIFHCCQALASLDVIAALAHLAIEDNYCCPKLDESLNFMVNGGAHPIVANALKQKNNCEFVRNDCFLDDQTSVYLITGPNMAGKSTFMRQNALIAILAQIGSYVPAQSAHIGIIDRLFSRVGAADDLASGRSTFMVEMVETAAILHQATERSFVILDEIGRGTATFDGLSIAWATTEHLCQQNKCRTLFATHYHEMTALEQQQPSLKCYTMRIKEWEDKIIFMHEVVAGTADKSYGIHVAALAGLPASVLARSQVVLASLEKQHKQESMMIQQAQPLIEIAPNKIEEQVITLDIDSLSPRGALELLYKLKGMALS